MIYFFLYSSTKERLHSLLPIQSPSTAAVCSFWLSSHFWHNDVSWGRLRNTWLGLTQQLAKHPEHGQFIWEFELFCYPLWALSSSGGSSRSLFTDVTFPCPFFHPQLVFLSFITLIPEWPTAFGCLLSCTLQWHLLFWYIESSAFKGFL